MSGPTKHYLRGQHSMQVIVESELRKVQEQISELEKRRDRLLVRKAQIGEKPHDQP